MSVWGRVCPVSILFAMQIKAEVLPKYRTEGDIHDANGKNKTKQKNNEKPTNNLAIMIIG